MSEQSLAFSVQNSLHIIQVYTHYSVWKWTNDHKYYYTRHGFLQLNLTTSAQIWNNMNDDRTQCVGEFPDNAQCLPVFQKRVYAVGLLCWDFWKLSLHCFVIIYVGGCLLCSCFVIVCHNKYFFPDVNLRVGIIWLKIGA